jgi:hypothetical protein
LDLPQKMFEKLEIHWEDSVMDQSGWADIGNFDYEAHIRAMQYETSGYFLKKTENALFVCQSCRKDKDQACGIMAIPFTAIKKIIRIKE